MREWIYGTGDPIGNEALYVERYERHNREVLEYFSARPNDLLILRLTDDDCWEKLCGFLNLPVPDIPFPHENRAEEREARQQLTRVTSETTHRGWKRALQKLFRRTG